MLRTLLGEQRQQLAYKRPEFSAASANVVEQAHGVQGARSSKNRIEIRDFSPSVSGRCSAQAKETRMKVNANGNYASRANDPMYRFE